MTNSIDIRFHRSQFPDAVRAELVRSLREGAINPKFHYDSYKQTRKWLALHQAYSPSRTDTDCAATYDAAFASASSIAKTDCVHLVGLGCGGGQKDTRLLRLLARPNRRLIYTPVDVSAAMVQVAAHEASPVATIQTPVVADFQLADHLGPMLQTSLETETIFTFFGMIPNFEPAKILPRLRQLLCPGDLLLFSANLAPGPEYRPGVQRVLPLYDNELTRDWLMTFLLDLGLEKADGDLSWRIEGNEFLRIAAYFTFRVDRTISIDAEEIHFKSGDQLRLFFSYRYTPLNIRELLNRHGLAVREQWITRSEEEGVFLCRLR